MGNSIKEGMIDFDLEYFLSPTNEQRREYDNGSILLITAKQIILALNDDNGKGSHDFRFAEAFNSLYGMPIENERIATSGTREYLCKRIYARIVNEKDENIAKLYFPLSHLESITENEYLMFKKFYDEYNEIIRKASRKYGLPIVYVEIPSRKRVNSVWDFIKAFFSIKSDILSEECMDLTFLLKSLKRLVDKKKVDEDEKVIKISEKEITAYYQEKIEKLFEEILEFFKKYQELFQNDKIMHLKDGLEKEIKREAQNGLTLKKYQYFKKKINDFKEQLLNVIIIHQRILEKKKMIQKNALKVGIADFDKENLNNFRKR